LLSAVTAQLLDWYIICGAVGDAELVTAVTASAVLLATWQSSYHEMRIAAAIWSDADGRPDPAALRPLTICNIIDETLYFVAHASHLFSCIFDCADSLIKRILGIGNCTHYNSMQPAAVSGMQQQLLLNNKQHCLVKIKYTSKLHISAKLLPKPNATVNRIIQHMRWTSCRELLYMSPNPMLSCCQLLTCSSVRHCCIHPVRTPVHSSASTHTQMNAWFMLQRAWQEVGLKKGNATVGLLG
jgi:hypothetical protein